MQTQTNSDLVSGEIKPNSTTPRTDGLIALAMARNPGRSARAEADYYEDVHQDLAPLARQMESEIIDLVKALQDLLDDHQHMEPHHADLCQTCLSAAAALRKADLK